MLGRNIYLFSFDLLAEYAYMAYDIDMCCAQIYMGCWLGPISVAEWSEEKLTVRVPGELAAQRHFQPQPKQPLSTN